MDDERSRGAQEWFRRGTEAMNHQNFDYAAECFANSVRMQPSNVLYRQTRHGCIRKMYGDNGSGARMASMKLMGIRTRIKKAQMQKDWKNLETAAEEGLFVNPWDPQLYYELGEACNSSENFDVAKYAYSRAVELDRENVDYNRRLGHFLRERGDYNGAIGCFQRVQKKLPTDPEARSMINKLQAESVMVRGGYGEANTTKDVQVEKKEEVNAYEADRRARKGMTGKSDAAPGESVEMDLQHAIRKEPKNLNHYLKLADHYRAERNLLKAQAILQSAMEVSDNNPDIAEQLEDVQLMLLRSEIAEAEDRVQKNPGKERLVEKAKTLRHELVQKELDCFARRIIRHPMDMKMHFDLAERYRETKQWSRAIPLLQKAVSDSRLKADALVALGDCFVRDGKLDLGRRQFEKSLELLNSQDNPESFKLAHYMLGRIYEKAKNADQAEHHYHEILAVDYEYRDVLKRLEGGAGGVSAEAD
ncbi:MAG: tetratricopeptide repeat protein [Planctomyces sp.]